MKIVFMGTPEFAVTSLSRIISKGIEVLAVVTVPDRKSGRGQKLTESPVKTKALEAKIPVLQPEKLKDPDFIAQLRSYKADLFVVVAFRMLPKEVWSMPPKGTINLHGSLLPSYRGAAPINWAIINGEKETGVTTFFIDEKIDTGEIIDHVSVPIGKDETAGELHDKMMVVGAELLATTIENIFQHNFTTKEQKSVDENSIKHAPKIYKEDCLIDWSNNYETIFNKIRGLSPYPAAFCRLETPNGIKTMKLFKADLVEDSTSIEKKIYINNHEISFGAKGGQIKLIEIQLEGKNRVNIKDFLNGFDFNQCKLT